jgi:hypothetical protein
MRKTIDAQIRQEIEDTDWNELLPRLLKYAHYKCRFLYRFGNIMADPEELVGQSIALAFGVGKDDSYRKWNKETFPNLVDFLISIINSLVSHLKDHNNKFPKESLETLEFPSTANNPEDDITEKDNLDKIQKRIFQAIEGDEEVETVVLCINEGFITPREVSGHTGININQVNNIMKRMRRKLRPLHDELFPEKGH